jgi:hypothetical protein
MTRTIQINPNNMTTMEEIYGVPTQAGFGSAVFIEQLNSTDDLEKIALKKYRYFVGDLWERYGQDTWIGPWKEVYRRPKLIQPDIIAELRSIKDPQASISVPMILDNIQDPEKARLALSSVYDEPAITDLRVYNLGDGGVMSGLLIAGRHGDTGEAIFLVFLMD